MPYEAESMFAKIIGPLATVQSVAAMGGDPAKHIADFHKYEPGHYAYAKGKGPAMWEDANYYDRVKIYYTMHAAQLDADKADEYLAKGHELALNYRDHYAPNGDVSAHWSMPVGIALHYLLTNDQISKNWLMNVGATMSAPYYTNGIGDTDHTEMDNRIQARCLESWILCWLLTGAEKWRTLLRTGLTDILGTQGDDGAYRFYQQGYNNKPFMVGVLHDAFIFYCRCFEHDARIAPAIKKANDYMWADNWNASDGAFVYQENDPNGDGGSPDLNNLLINGYVELGMVDEVELILRGSLNAWLDGSKQFNQTYVQTYHSLARADNATSAWSGVKPPDPIPPDPDEEEDVDVDGALSALATAQRSMAEASVEIATAVRLLGGEEAHLAMARRYPSKDEKTTKKRK